MDAKDPHRPNRLRCDFDLSLPRPLPMACISHGVGPRFWRWDKKCPHLPSFHEFTSWIRIPDAVLGVFAYLSDVVFSLAGSKQRWQDRPWLVVLFGICVIPVGCVSIILVVLQGLVVKSWCFLCLITASISLILIFLAYGEVIASCRYLHKVWKRTNLTNAWWSFWGYPCRELIERDLCGQESLSSSLRSG